TRSTRDWSSDVCSSDLARARTVGAFEARTDPEMESDPMADRHARVEHVAIERMNESVPPRDRPIRPLGDTRRAEELSPSREPVRSEERRVGKEGRSRGA